MVLTHNGFGVTFTLPTDEWSISPAGRFGISIQNSKLKLSFRLERQGMADKQPPATYRENGLKSAEKVPDKTAILSRDDKMTIAGGTEAVGISTMETVVATSICVIIADFYLTMVFL